MKPLSNLILKIDEFPPEGLVWEQLIAPEDFLQLLKGPDDGGDTGTLPTLLASVEWHLKIQVSGSRILLKGSMVSVAEAGCDRCLDETPFRLESEVDEVLKMASSSGHQQDDDEDDDTLIAVSDGRVDFGPILAELFWLAWPFQVLCSSKCLGLCAKCGANLNLGACPCSGGAS